MKKNIKRIIFHIRQFNFYLIFIEIIVSHESPIINNYHLQDSDNLNRREITSAIAIF